MGTVICRVLLGTVLALALISGAVSQAPASITSSKAEINSPAAPVQQTPATPQKAAADAPVKNLAAVQQQAPAAAGPEKATPAPAQAVQAATATSTAAADSTTNTATNAAASAAATSAKSAADSSNSQAARDVSTGSAAEQPGSTSGSATSAAATVSQVVLVAPAAVVDQSSDINPDGACKSFIASVCDGIEFADGQVADCLADYQKGVEAQAETGGLSDECNEEVMQLKIQRNTNINRNTPLAKACTDDANKYCNMTWFTGYSNGSVIACLRDVKDKLKPQCKKQVFRVQLDASYDYRVDRLLHEACHKDAETLCPGVKLGGGRIQECLKKKRLKLGWDCSAELFRKEVEDTDDIRLSIRLFRACLADKKQYCADVAPGQAMAKQCLEEHLHQLSSSCRSELESAIEQRVRIFRLDSRLRKACKDDIHDTCAYLGDMDTLSDYDELLVNCLQDFASEIKNQACQMQVHKYVELAAQDIRFDVPLADACYEDRQKLCANVPPGSARVIRCLQNQRDKLGVVCRATLMSEEMRFSENIDFQFPMQQACQQEMDLLCRDVPHGAAKVIRCLQSNKGHKHFGKACRAEVERYEQESAKDYRLNFRLYRACKADVGKLCKDACNLQDGEICGGKVVSCLSDNKASIKAEACRQEVTYLEKLEVNDFRTDMVLAEACRGDVNKFCSAVEPGEGRVHKCLRDHAAQLTPQCRKEEMHLERKEADNVQMSVSLLKTCANERSLFCRDVAPGSARVFRCLAGNLASADFGGPCKDMIIQKLKRRDANWRLDPALRKACAGDVDRLCSKEDSLSSETGAVKKCMISHRTELSPGCQQELARSLHMSFFVWQPKGIMTEPCDADIQKLCLSQAPEVEVAPGAVSNCLADIVLKMSQSGSPNKRRLLADAKDAKQQPKQKQKHDNKKSVETSRQQEVSPSSKNAGTAINRAQTQQQPQHQGRYKPQLSKQCYELAALEEPPKVDQSYDIKAMAFSVLQSSLDKVEQTTGWHTVTRDRHGAVRSVSLTGWTAIVGMVALVLVMMAGATMAVRQYLGHGDKDGYTLVMKQAPGS